MEFVLSFEGLQENIADDLQNNIPNELDVLSTHTNIEYVDDIEIDDASIKNGIISVNGTGIVHVYTQIGSDGDLRERDAITGTYDFLFNFWIK